MLVRYSIVELLMVFEVSAQREHTIVSVTLVAISMLRIARYVDNCIIISMPLRSLAWPDPWIARAVPS